MSDKKDYKDESVQSDDRFGGEDKERRPGRPKFFRKKVCRFCANRNEVDYKDIEILGRYVTERGKILPARITGACARHQRAIATAVKRARHLALLPFVAN